MGVTSSLVVVRPPGYDLQVRLLPRVAGIAEGKTCRVLVYCALSSRRQDVSDA